MDTRVAALAEASARIFGAQSLGETLRLIAEEARAIAGAHQCIAALAGGADAPPMAAASLSEKYAAWRGRDAAAWANYAALLDGGESRPLRLSQHELEAHPAFARLGAGEHPAPRGWLSAPLVARDGSRLGLVQLSDKQAGDFDAGDEAMLVHVARLGATAIDTVRRLEALGRAARRFHEFAEIGSEVLWETGPDHRYTLFLAKGSFRMNTPPETYLGKTRWEAAGADPNTPLWAAHIAELEAHRPIRNFEYPVTTRRDGARHFLRVNANPIFDSAGRFLGYRGATANVTDLRLAEAAARASENRFRRFASIASDWLWETDAEHRFVFFAGANATLDERPYGKTRWEIAGVDAADPAWRAHVADLEARRPFRNFEYTRRDASGRLRYVSVSGDPQFDEDGAFRGYLGTASEITAQREAEAEVRKAAERYRDIVETANEGVWLVDAEVKTTFVNRRMAEMLGYSPEEIIGRSVYEFRPLEDRVQRESRWAARKRGVAEQREARFVRRDGTVFWAQISAQPLFDAERKFLGSLGMVTDITERKAAEAALRASQDRFRDFAEVGSDWLWETDAEHRISYISGAPVRLDQEPLGRTRWQISGAEPTDPAWREHLADLEARRPFRDFEYTVVGKDGRVHHLVSSGRPKFDEAGTFLGYRGTTTDRTAQREAEAKARASEHRFVQLVETANEGVWIVDAEMRTTYVNRRVPEMLGYAPEEILGRPFVDFKPEKDRAATLAVWREKSRTGLEPVETRMRRKDGSTLWVLMSAVPHFDGEGRFVGVFAMMVDITERKRAEEALRQAKREVDTILAGISDGCMALDNQGRFIYANAAAERLCGRRAEDFVGRTAAELLGIESDNPFRMTCESAKQLGAPIALTAYSTLFGMWIEARAHPNPDGLTIFFRDVSEERRAHRALLKSMKKLESAREMNARIFESSLDLICITDRDGTFVQVNPGAVRQFGYLAEELIGRNASDFIEPDGIERTRSALRAAKRSHSLHTFENRCLRKDGKAVPMHWSAAWSEKEQKYYLIGRDMTERIQAEERLNRSQRLEAIGQLTGGIAHDFNNLLTVIMGNSDMLAHALKDRDNLRRRAELSLEAARRAAELTGQLLAFARRQTLAPKAVEPNKLVTGMLELVRRTLGAQIEIALRLDEEPWQCKVDSTQLETAILNLALNARDAMPEGGTLTIATSHRTLPPGSNGHSDLAGGDYVVIDVCDTGTGMSPEVLARAFEPFFTTKDIGKGSGLGLAMVYGFVKQSGGHVAIESEPGRGTRVSLFLPRAVEPAAVAASAPRDDAPLPGGRETILVVEDDPAVREFVTESLRRLGYRVLAAGNGSIARNILFGGEKVDLLFTDIMMPGGITGTQLAAEVEARLPGLPILFTTGYADAPALKASAGRPGVSLLRKPYKTRELALTVRSALHPAA